MKKIIFTKGNWEDKLFHAMSYRFKKMPEFVQEEDCIVNSKNDTEDGVMGYDYITVMSKETYGQGTKITSEVLFEEYGAPLLTISKDLDVAEDGTLHFGTYYEVVLWENGINVWEMYMENGEVKWHLVLGNEFKVEKNTRHTFTVELQDKRLKVTAGEHCFTVRAENLPRQAHIGIAACENINRIYSMTIE